MTCNTYTYTFDSVTVSVFNPLGVVQACQLFVKRCHSIEDSAF
jgi:hypothetical protein